MRGGGGRASTPRSEEWWSFGWRHDGAAVTLGAACGQTEWVDTGEWGPDNTAHSCCNKPQIIIIKYYTLLCAIFSKLQNIVIYSTLLCVIYLNWSTSPITKLTVFLDLRRNQLWQWLEEACRNRMFGTGLQPSTAGLEPEDKAGSVVLRFIDSIPLPPPPPLSDSTPPPPPSPTCLSLC